MSRIIKSSNLKLDGGNKFVIETKRVEQEMPVIAAHVDEEGMDEAALVLHKAKKEAEEILAEANKNAEMLIAEVRKKCEEEKSGIFDAAYVKGYEHGKEEGLQSAAELRAEAEGMAAEAEEYRRGIYEGMEGELVELIAGIAGKLTADTVRINPMVIVNLIKQGMAEATATGDINVRVSPEDYDTVLEHRESILPRQSGGSEIEIMRDASLAKSDCVIETSFGNIDLSIDRQFGELKQNLYYIYKNGSGL